MSPIPSPPPLTLPPPSSSANRTQSSLQTSSRSISTRSSRPLPTLPPHVWYQIITHAPDLHTLSSLSLTSSLFASHLISSFSQSLWQAVWDSISRLPSSTLISSPWLQVPGGWRAQVAASRFLTRLPQSRLFYLPPRYHPDGSVVLADRVRTSPTCSDLEDVLGRACVAVALGNGVVVGFEGGVGYVTRIDHNIKLFWDDAHIVRGGAIAKREKGCVVMICANAVLIKVKVKKGRWPLTWSALDHFGVEGGNAVSLAVAHGRVFVGFDSGRIRIVDLEKGSCRRVCSMAESVDILCANTKYLMAINTFQPICACVWDVQHGHPIQDFRNTVDGWGSLKTVAGVCCTRNEDVFAIWDGKNALRMVNVSSGQVLRVTKVRGTFNREVQRSIGEAGEEAGAAAHLGYGRMVPFHDKKKAVVATSNRVFAMPLHHRWRPAKETVQIEGARRALVALTTDDTVLVTAETDAYGELRYKIVATRSINARPRLAFWSVQNGKQLGELQLPSPASSLSVCGDIVAAVCPAVGQVVIGFAIPADFKRHAGGLQNRPLR